MRKYNLPAIDNNNIVNIFKGISNAGTPENERGINYGNENFYFAFQPLKGYDYEKVKM